MKAEDSQLKLETKGVWIPICIWDNKDLTLQEKAVLVKVESFKECFASNEYLSGFVNVSVSRIKQVLKSLEEKGYIFRVVHRKEKVIVKRVISVNKVKFYGIDDELESCPSSDIGQESVPSKDSKLSYPRAESCLDNSKANNSSINKEPLSSKPDIASKVIQYLNDKTGSKFRATPSHTKFIDARIAEGATPQDLIAVINRKCAEWLDDPKFSQYLRPSTLFNATKFNDYVGQLDTPLPAKGSGKSDHASRHTGFDNKDYSNGLIEQEDGSHAF